MMLRRSAVSLVEAMVAMVVVTGLLIVVYELFSGGMRSASRGTELLTSVRDFNVVGERLRKDARSLLVTPENPVTVSPDGGELSMTVIEGVTADGLPVANRVVYRLEPGTTGERPLGSLVRVHAPDGPSPVVHRYFVDALQDFTVTKYGPDGASLPGDDLQTPAFIECRIADGRGQLFAPRFHLYSRYSRAHATASPAEFWLPNHLVRPASPTCLVITDFGSSVVEVDCSSLRIVGGVAMDSGAMVSGSF